MPGTVQSLTRDECLSRLAGHSVGRVSASRDALPVIVPVVYLRDGSNIVFRAPLHDGFAARCDNAVIAFEAGDLLAEPGWSVLVIGVASLLSSAEQLRQRGPGKLNEAGEGGDQLARVGIERVSGQVVSPGAHVAIAG